MTELLDDGSFYNLNEAKLEISHHIAEDSHSALGYLVPTTSEHTSEQCPDST
jgi:putative transposase